ncbi:MAG: NAD(P)-dependent oxidoreductase [Dehalococcoidia bacterium]|nr:NAD(P)-dependent oxidoreductase [Dehalococcoidia bacterium]
MTDRIGFIGLGIMGRPMARNLMKAGFPLTVWNRSRPGIDELVSEGAAEGGSPADVARRSDVVITIVGDSPDVEEVALGTNGIIEGPHPGLVHIDMSTISPDVTRRIAERLAEAGVEMLDAPVSGGQQGAIEGTLSIMVGGKAETLERCRPVLAAMGGKIVHCGPAGAGQTVKLCNQIAVALTNLGVCEALVFAARSGIDPRVMIEAVSAGAGTSWQLQNLAPRIVERDFRPGFKVAHQRKDLRLALEAAKAMAAPLPGTGLVAELFSALEADGLGEEGTQALVKALEKAAGVEVH